MGSGERTAAKLAAGKIALTLGLIAVGAWREHREMGIEAIFLSFAWLQGAFLVRSWLEARGVGAPRSLASFALELATFLGLLSYPISVWSPIACCLLLAAALGRDYLALDDPTEPPRLERALAGALALLVGGFQWLCVRGMHDFSWTFAVYALAGLEHVLPASERSASAFRRRVSTYCLVAAAALVRTQRERDATLLEAALLLLSLAYVVLGLVGIKVRDRSRRLRILFRAVTLLAIPVLVLALGEVVFRVAVPVPKNVSLPPKITGSWHSPGGTACYYAPSGGSGPDLAPAVNEFRWNEDGFHDREHEHAKPAGCIRVALLGDSYVDGYQLPVEDLLHRRLEEKLRPLLPPGLTVECLSFGHGGWCQRDELLAFEKKVQLYSPDLVLVEFLGFNDVLENSPELSAYTETPTRFRDVTNWANVHGLRFTSFLADRLDSLTSPAFDIGKFVYVEKPPHPEMWDGAWARTDDAMGGFASETAKQGMKLAVISFTTVQEVAARVDPSTQPRGLRFDLPATRMAKLLEKRAIPFLDLAGRFAKYPPEVRDRLHIPNDGHWGKLGHDRAASETVAFLTSETGIWKAVVAKAQEKGVPR